MPLPAIFQCSSNPVVGRRESDSGFEELTSSCRFTLGSPTQPVPEQHENTPYDGTQQRTQRTRHAGIMTQAPTPHPHPRDHCNDLNAHAAGWGSPRSV
jgi:hypothetical protein